MTTTDTRDMPPTAALYRIMGDARQDIRAAWGSVCDVLPTGPGEFVVVVGNGTDGRRDITVEQGSDDDLSIVVTLHVWQLNAAVPPHAEVVASMALRGVHLLAPGAGQALIATAVKTFGWDAA